MIKIDDEVPREQMLGFYHDHIKDFETPAFRVGERKGAQRKPFAEAQVEIRKKIKDQRAAAQIKAYFEQRRKDVTVWTVFDGPPGKGSPRAAGERGRG
jgi:hypothetical protein